MKMKNGKLLLVALVFLAVFFFLALVIPRQVDVLCQGTSSTYMRGTAWQSTSYALFGIGVTIPPPVACIAGSVKSSVVRGLDLLSSTPGITVVVGFPFTASPESPCTSEALASYWQ